MHAVYIAPPPPCRFSFTACEILCCELDDVLSSLITDAELMCQLFSLLDQPAPLNSTLAGYFGRVVGSLLSKRPQQMHEYLEAHRGILDKLVTHVDTTSTVEVILRLIGADDLAAANSGDHATWLGETSLMRQLLDALCVPPAGSNKLERLQRAAQANIGNILVAVAHSQCVPMFQQLTQPDYLQQLLEAASAPRDAQHCDVLQPVLLVCIALLDSRGPRPPLAAAPMAFGVIQPFEPSPDPEVLEARAAARAAVANEIVHFVPHFTALLDNASQTGGAEAATAQPYGMLKPPLGRQRIAIIELGKALLRTEEPAAIRAIVRSQFIPKAMELFCAYPFNNILHLHVRDILAALIAAMTTKAGSETDGVSPAPAPPSATSSDQQIAVGDPATTPAEGPGTNAAAQEPDSAEGSAANPHADTAPDAAQETAAVMQVDSDITPNAESAAAEAQEDCNMQNQDAADADAAEQQRDAAAAGQAEDGEEADTRQAAQQHRPLVKSHSLVSEQSRSEAAIAVTDTDLIAEIQDCLFDRISLLSWLMEISEHADSKFFQARCRIVCNMMCTLPVMHANSVATVV